MKYYIFTFEGTGLPIAYHLQKEGCDVIVGQVQEKKDVISSIEKKTAEENEENKALRLSLYDNMIEKVPAWDLIEKMKEVKNRNDCFVFFDFNNLFKFADEVKKLGFNGNFPDEKDHLFEIDRDEAKNFVKHFYPNVRVANKYEFKTVEDAKSFLEKTEDIWVLKGKGEEARTVIPDIDDVILAKGQIIEALEKFRSSYESVGFILELMIPQAIEFTPEKIYYDGVPLATTMNIENKPLGSKNLSVQTGCAQDLVFPIEMTDRINKIAFPPIVDELAKNHKGLFFWDSSLLVHKKTGKMYFGEFCSNRPGYNSFFTELAQVQNVDYFFKSIIDKKNPFSLGTIASSIRVFNLHRHPDTDHILSGLRVDFKPAIEKDLWLFDVRKTDDKIETVGLDWNLAVITGSGKSIDEAVYKMYRNSDLFSFEGAYYRPKFDYLSLDYPTSILNRLNYGIERKLYSLPFTVKVGEIKTTER